MPQQGESVFSRVFESPEWTRPRRVQVEGMKSMLNTLEAFLPLSGAERLGSLLGKVVSPIWWGGALCTKKRSSVLLSNTHNMLMCPQRDEEPGRRRRFLDWTAAGSDLKTDSRSPLLIRIKAWPSNHLRQKFKGKILALNGNGGAWSNHGSF